jgi:hypothetical protein
MQKCAINVWEEGEVIALLQRCPNCGEKGGHEREGIDGCHEAASLGLGKLNQELLHS